MKSARIFAIGLFFETWVPRIFWPPGELKRVGHLDIEQRVREFLPELLALAGIVAIGVMIVALCLAEWVLMFWAMAIYFGISLAWSSVSGKHDLAILVLRVVKFFFSWPYETVPAQSPTLTLALRVLVVGSAVFCQIVAGASLFSAVPELLGAVPHNPWRMPLLVATATYLAVTIFECIRLLLCRKQTDTDTG